MENLANFLGGGNRGLQIGQNHGTIHYSSNVREEATDAKIAVELFITDPVVDRGKIRSAKGQRTPGTCEWIQQHTTYLDWLKPGSSLLWICGGPGRGKTMLSVYLTETLGSGRERQSTVLLLRLPGQYEKLGLSYSPRTAYKDEVGALDSRRLQKPRRCYQQPRQRTHRDSPRGASGEEENGTV
jgi:hypothetical protein